MFSGLWLYRGEVFAKQTISELQLMVQAGLTPIQALQTATINPALFFQITKDYGTVEEGKIANLVLLDKTHLKIFSIQRVYAIFINGEYLYKAVLKQRLQKLWYE